MPTKKQQPPSTNKQVEELKQLLKPSGISQSQMEFLSDVIGQVLDLFCQTDGKARHFLTLVFTRESDDPCPMVSIDTVSSLESRKYTLHLVEEWIARTKADVSEP